MGVRKGEEGAGQSSLRGRGCVCVCALTYDWPDVTEVL